MDTARVRRTKAELTEFSRAIWDIARTNEPCSARQVYYRALSARLIDKDASDSRKNEQRIGKALNEMRERYVDWDMAGSPGSDENYSWLAYWREHLIMPFGWIPDGTRTRWHSPGYRSRRGAVAGLAEYYRRNLWQSQPRLAEVWCESDSLRGVLQQVTSRWQVALLPCRGQSSKRFIWDSAQSYADDGRPVVVLYVGDFDPAGVDIRTSLKQRLIRYGAPEQLYFRRIAVTPQQVRELSLPGHGLHGPEKTLQRFIPICDKYGVPREAVEAEAMDARTMRELLNAEIERYIDPRQWELEQEVEEQERRSLREMLDGLED